MRTLVGAVFAVLFITGVLHAEDTRSQLERCINLGVGCDDLEAVQHMNRVLSDIPRPLSKKPAVKAPLGAAEAAMVADEKRRVALEPGCKKRCAPKLAEDWKAYNDCVEDCVHAK